jgi:hypothetical protein
MSRRSSTRWYRSRSRRRRDGDSAATTGLVVKVLFGMLWLVVFLAKAPVMSGGYGASAMPIATGRAGRDTPIALYRENGPCGGTKPPPYLATPLVTRRASSQPFRKRLKPEELFRRPIRKRDLIGLRALSQIDHGRTSTEL